MRANCGQVFGLTGGANGERKSLLRSVAGLPARLPMRFASEGRTVLKVGLSFLLTAAGQSWILARFPFQRRIPKQRESERTYSIPRIAN